MVRQGNAEPRFKYLPSSHRCYRIGEVARAGLAVLLAIVFAAAPLCSTSFAGNGTVTTIPRAAAAAKHGLQMDVDTRGVDGNGYRPVRIRVYTSNGRPSGSDRTLLVEFSPNGNYGYGQQQVSKRITLARGAFSAEMTMLVRQSASTANLRTAVYESGHRIPEMNSTAVIANGGEETEMWPSMLHIDSRAPRRNQLERIRRGGGKGPVHAEFVDFRALAQLSPAVKFTRTSKPNALPAATLHPNDPKARTTDVLNGLRDAPMCDLIPLTELPDNWLALSTYDLTFISIEDLEKLQATPKTALALEHWTRAGHSLYVYDAKKSPVTEGLRRVDSVLQGGFSGWQVGTVSDDDRIEEYNTHSSRNGNRAKKTLGAINKNRTCDFLRIRDCGLGRDSQLGLARARGRFDDEHQFRVLAKSDSGSRTASGQFVSDCDDHVRHYSGPCKLFLFQTNETSVSNHGRHAARLDCDAVRSPGLRDCVRRLWRSDSSSRAHLPRFQNGTRLLGLVSNLLFLDWRRGRIAIPDGRQCLPGQVSTERLSTPGSTEPDRMGFEPAVNGLLPSPAHHDSIPCGALSVVLHVRQDGG